MTRHLETGDAGWVRALRGPIRPSGLTSTARARANALVLPVVVLAFSAAFIHDVIHLSLAAKGYPIVVASGLAIMSLFAIVRELRRPLPEAKETRTDTNLPLAMHPASGSGHPLAVVVTSLLFIAAVLGTSQLGILWMIAIYVPVQLLVLGERTWWKVLLITGACLAIVYFVFYELFLITLPL